MRRRFSQFLSVVLLLLISFSVSVFAHPGRTDSRGGHYDRSTGIYHYHHGYPAHQHTDGVCPYDFDDKTNHSSSGSGSKTEKEEKPVITYVEPIKKSKPVINNTTVKNIVLIVFISIVILVCIMPFIYMSIKDKINRKREDEERIRKQHEFNEQRELMIQKYGGRPISDFVNIPSDSMIGEDGLPREINAEEYWGEKYTFYQLNYYNKYHNKQCRHASICSPINAYKLKKQKSEPCWHCKPKLPDLDWVDEYRKIQEIKKKYDIE